MRAYKESSEEALHARDLLKDWAGEGFIMDAQYRQMEQETPTDLRRTNIFMRLVLALFTFIIVGAGIGLLFVVFLSAIGDGASGVFALIFAGVTYFAAEVAVSQKRMYRHGIEEALMIASVGLLCAGLLILNDSSPVIPIAGAASSIWIWHRFGLPYAPVAAMSFVGWFAVEMTWDRVAQHVSVAVLFAVGLAVVTGIRRPHRFTYLDVEYSIAEALLWFGIYAAMNLQISALGYAASDQFPKAFYWATYVFTWCWPPVVLTVGLRKKDRWVMAVGGITAILTLATNKSYLGWERHTWDPMMLGLLLIGTALLVKRWLAGGADEVRRGFTARRLSGKDKRWLSVGAVAVGVVSPEVIPQGPQTSGPEFGGGASGGGGASSDF